MKIMYKLNNLLTILRFTFVDILNRAIAPALLFSEILSLFNDNKNHAPVQLFLNIQ